MVKILSQAGSSLADMYDVEGSIAGIDQLRTEELPIVHEMGATLFSERFRTTFRRATTGLMTQNFSFDFTMGFPEGIARILGVQVLTDDAARLLHVQVSLNDPQAEQDFPVWVWDGTNLDVVRIQDDGTTNDVLELLVPRVGLQIPCFATNRQTHSGQEMSSMILRGRTTGFGAGSVFATVLVNFAFTFRAGVSNFGSRNPSW